MAAAFGSVFAPEMTIAHFDGNGWSTPQLVSSSELTLHPAAHVLHYASTCFEGLKAFRHADGSIHIFRIDQNLQRFAQSSQLVGLPPIDQETSQLMIVDLVNKYKDLVPEAPGSLYIRPTHIGTDPCVGKAAAPSSTSSQYVLISPVGDYFAAGDTALRLLVDEEQMRCAPHNGMVKSGGNYASALGPITRAKADYQADQVLFSPGGVVQETGAANFLLFDGDDLITPELNSTFLHGITRASILKLARDAGYNVIEKTLTVSDLLGYAKKPNTEAALSGTAAVLAPVGTLIYQGEEILIGDGSVGKKAIQLREQLNNIQWGKADDKHGWLTKVA